MLGRLLLQHDNMVVMELNLDGRVEAKREEEEEEDGVGVNGSKFSQFREFFFLFFFIS